MTAKKKFIAAIIFLYVCVLSARSYAVPAFVSNVIYDFKNDEITFNMGPGRGIKPGDVFEVVREGERLGVLKAVEVSPLYTRMQIIVDEQKKGEEGIIGTIISAAEAGKLMLPREQAAAAPVESKGKEPKKNTTPEKPAVAPEAANPEELSAPVKPVGQRPALPETAKTATATSAVPPQAAGQQNAKKSDSGEPAANDFVVMDKELTEKVKDKKVDVKLSGYRYLKYRSYSADGDETNFLSRNGLLTQGSTYEQGSQLQAKMSYGGNVSLNGSFIELPYQERDMEFELLAGNYRALFGDVATDLRTGELGKIQKEITGTQLQYTTKKLEMDYLASRSRSEPQTISFYGDNTHGPFSLEAFEVLENSETVRINGVVVPREEYDIDYYLGQITFCTRADSTDCREVKTSDRVQVEFEEKMLLAMKGGNLFGVSSKYNFNEGRSLGFAYVEQEANKASERIRKSATYTATGSEIDSQTDCPASTICLPKTYQNTYTLMAKNFEKVYYNGQVWTNGEDYVLDDEGYAEGELELTSSYTASDVFRIEYTYYDKDFVQEVEFGDENSEYTSEIGNETYFILRKSRIYEGTETVRYCKGLVEDPCSDYQLLEYGVDYDIYEDGNALQIINNAYLPNDTTERYIQIAYLYVPSSSDNDSQYNQTVTEVYGKTNLGGVSLEFDFGRSESDIAKTPIQVLREQLTNVTGTYTCPVESGASGECVFSLENSNIIELSETLTITTTDVPLQRGVEYDIEYDTGVVELKGGVTLATGTIVFADYQYNPDVAEGIVDGKALRLKAATQISDFNIGLELGNSDTYFSPIGGNNTLETSRLDLSLDGNINDNLSLTLKKSSFDIARDIFESSTTGNDQLDAAVKYRTTRGYTFEYNYGKDEAIDDLATHKADDSRKRQGMKIGMPGIWKPDLTLTLARDQEDFSDNTDTNYDTSTRKNTIEVTYKKNNSMDLKANIATTEVDSSGLGDPFSTENVTRGLLLSFYPFDLLNVEADINHQRKTDSRPAAGVSGKDTSSIRVSSKPFGKFKSAVVNVLNQSYPGQFSGTTNSKTIFASFAYALTSALTMTPGITKTDTSSESYSTNSDRRTLMLDYRPYRKKYSTTIKQEWGNTDSQSDTSAPTSSDQQRFNWDFLYKFSPKTNFIYRFDNQKNSFSSGSSSTSRNRSVNVVHIPSKKKRYSLVYRTNDRSDSSSSSQEQTYRFESDIKLSDIIRWTTKFSMSEYTNDTNPGTNYDGTLLESEFRAEF